ncbi:MAG: hypothetical protein NWQ24_10970 [Haliea sp.]|nr:hypothetical protein [Haliea sp.]
MALLTRHAKDEWIAPPLLSLGVTLSVTDAFDTDQLGTFSGEVERKLTPLECARRKAQLACELTGLDFGLGSEGSFGGGPMPGLLNWDEELLVFWDRSAGQEIVAYAAGPVRVSSCQWRSPERLEAHIAANDAKQAWIIRHPAGVMKGLCGAAELLDQLHHTVLPGMSDDQAASITIEPDLRAMHCPERQIYIYQAAQQLAARLQSLCPRCAAVNFWPSTQVPGLPCEDCGAPTPLPLAAIVQCQCCEYEIRQPVEHTVADPQHCSWCNP